MTLPALAFIGFGEAAQALCAGFRTEGVSSFAAFDILFSEAAGARLREAAERIGVRMGRDTADAVRGADIVFSAVTAASNLDAATQAATGLQAGQFYVDLNSVSPARKRQAGEIVGRRGARFAGMAVMAPVHPLRHKTPALVSGPAAGELVPLLRRCGMQVEEVGADPGAAAAIKMVRSVMVKGLGALTQECFLAARRAGVEERLIASLAQSYPMIDWAKFADYNLERMATHGLRRAAEMREVCETLESLGVEPAMTRGTVIREQRTGDARLREKFGGKVPEDRAAILQALIERRGEPLV